MFNISIPAIGFAHIDLYSEKIDDDVVICDSYIDKHGTLVSIVYSTEGDVIDIFTEQQYLEE